MVAVTQLATRDAIAEQQREARRRALLEILPAHAFDNAILDDAVTVRDPRLGTSAPVQALIARRDGAPVAAIVPVTAPDGYSGAIRMIVGLRPDGVLIGVRVIEHHETPGLGDAVEVRKSDWITRFRGRALGDPPAAEWAVRKDGGAFDAFTGATITPRAVIGAVRRTLEWFADSGRAQLFPDRDRSGALVPPADDPGTLSASPPPPAPENGRG